jgi:hypothetical protein
VGFTTFEAFKQTRSFIELEGKLRETAGFYTNSKGNFPLCNFRKMEFSVVMFPKEIFFHSKTYLD